jgi:uncharacterized membrane protein
MKHNRPESSFKATTRLEAFSDAVFAIAITLLVLDLITVLHHDNGKSFMENCRDNWESFFAFVIGFITILVCWINHHIALEPVIKVNTRFFWINGFLLFLITLTPFPTAVLAEYLGKESHTALAVFGFNYFLISIAAYMICSYAYRHHLIDEDHRTFYRAYRSIYLYAMFYTFITFLLSLITIIIPVILYAILFIVFAAPRAFTMRLQKFNKRTSK